MEQAEIAEKSAKKFEPSVPKNKWGPNTKGYDATQFFQSKGKETIAVELSGQLNRSRKEAQVAITNSSSWQKSIPSKTSKW